MTLRIRLLLALAAVVAVGLIAAGAVTYTSLHSFLVSRVDQQLCTEFNPVRTELNQVPGAGFQGGPAGGQGGGGQSALVPPGTVVVVLTTSGTQLETRVFGGSGTAPTLSLPANFPVAATPAPGATSACPQAFNVSATSGGGYRAVAWPVYFVSGAQAGQSGTLVVAQPLSDLEQTAHRLLLIEILVFAAVMAALAASVWFIVRRGLKPLEQMADTAGAIAAGDLSRRVPETGDRGEVGQLGSALNTMLGEIEQAFAARAASEERLRRFLADASHELRTPLTSIRGYAEMFDRGARDRPEDLATSMRHIRSEADRMGRLVEDLLLLARLDRERPLDLAEVDLSEVVAEAVGAARVAHPDRAVSLAVPGPVPVLADRGRLRQVVDNLLANAAAYTPAGSPIEVAVRPGPDATSAAVTVGDHGPGVAPDERRRIFEPFHRADASRTRATGGVGLGLAIASAIVRAHGGTVFVGDRPDQAAGAWFTVTIPTRLGVADAPSGYGANGTGPAREAAVDGEARTEVNEQTRGEQAGEALAAHQADRPATPEEEEAAERGSAGVDRSVSEHEHEMTRRGASVQGEGQV